MLYEAAVQNPDESVSAIRRFYRKKREKPPRTMREDFCGTAAISAEWVRNHKDNRAWGVDLDEKTLEWGREHNLTPLGNTSNRVTLVQADVMSADVPLVDVINAFNFSYFVFKDRERLRAYFESVYRGLKPDGMFVCDIFGGTETMMENREVREIGASEREDGTQVPPFKYYWEHANFNVIDHHIRCHIHFKVRGNRKFKRAFTYDWRLWTIPEVRELLAEAGFVSTDAYIHGWTQDGESDDIFRRRTNYENTEGWIGYIAAYK